MGSVALWLILVMDGNGVFIQERFENKELCQIAAIKAQQMADETPYIKYRNHNCIETAVTEEK